jgi:hypothetical protein
MKYVYASRSVELSDAAKAASEASGWTEEGWATATPVLLETADGKTLALFHHAIDHNPPDFAWQADLIFCCHPEHLPTGLRKKHLFPYWRGVCNAMIDEGVLITRLYTQNSETRKESMEKRARLYAPRVVLSILMVINVAGAAFITTDVVKTFTSTNVEVKDIQN